MTHLVMQDKNAFVPELGDILACARWMRKQPSKDFFDLATPIPLSFWAYNPFVALRYAGIENANGLEREAYCERDLISCLPHYKLVPHVLYCTDLRDCNPDKMKFFGAQEAKDRDWMKERLHQDFREIAEYPDPPQYVRCMMGSGYGAATLPSDGAADIKVGWLALDNGDVVGCYYWQWFNV